MKQRVRFVLEVEEGLESVSELCRRYGISRVIGYKWYRRFQAEGLEGLEDRSRAPHRPASSVSGRVREQIVQLRQQHPRWGPRKIRWRLEQAGEKPPAASTIGEILGRAGLNRPQRRRRRSPPYLSPLRRAVEANDVWSVDFKGWFCAGDGTRCDPLTILDQYSRYLIDCRLVAGTGLLVVQKVFHRAFDRYGLPQVIRSDNGTPFASRGVGGLSRLSTWFLRLGITPERIRPGKPQDNGAHERMHRTLKEEAATPPQSTWHSQQRALERFRREYNEARPHDSLGLKPPSGFYTPSTRRRPPYLPPVSYPDSWTVRKVQKHGEFYWAGEAVFLGEALASQPVGLQPLEPGWSRLFFTHIPLAIFEEARSRILTPAEARRWKRERGR